MASKTSLKRGEETPRRGRGRARKYDPAPTVLWWESHGRPSALTVAKALGMPYYAALTVLRNVPEYFSKRVYAKNPKKLARRVAIVTWWREQGKPRLQDVALEFGISSERVRQILRCESDYDRCTCGPRLQEVRDALVAHPNWTVAQVAQETSCSQATVWDIARVVGHRFPVKAPPPYRPRGRVLKILQLHNQGLRRPEIAKRLGISNAPVWISLNRILARAPELLEVPIADGRRVGRAAIRKRRLRS